MNVLDNVILFMFLSFVVGVVVDPVLRRVTNYDWLSTRYLFAKQKTYERLGVMWFRRFLLVTPLGSFNRDIHITKERDLETLKATRDHMATAEMSHWVGFAFMLGMTPIAWVNRGSTVGTSYLVFNLLGNVYPCLLQQYNKRRIERLILAMEKRGAARLRR